MPKKTSHRTSMCVETVINQAIRTRALLPKSNRRMFFRLTTAALGTLGMAGPSAAATPLRFATTPVFLNDQAAMLGLWQRYLELQIGRPVRFIQRRTYREIVELLLTNEVDAAWLCGYPLVLHEDRLAALAVPVYQGAALYRSHLIVPQSDKTTRSVLDLRNQVFAYSDPLSNSGCLVPRSAIQMAGHDAATFFRRTFFTFSHRKVIEAVRLGLANAGAVDGYVWDTLAEQFPSSIANLRVAWRSEAHGFPPIVARKNWGKVHEQSLLDALLVMNKHEAGRGILHQLNIDGFSAPVAAQYDSIRHMLKHHPEQTP